MMDWRNRIGLYGSYFLGMAAIGFTLPYLPLYLGEKGLSDRAIGIVSTLAALSALAQFPVGLWSDRIGWRKPFLVVALAAGGDLDLLLREAHGVIWLGFLVILFAENGISRAVVESLSGAEAAALAPPGGVGAALGALRFWKPIGIVLVALLGSWMSEQYGVGAILLPLAVAQGLAVGFALLIHEPHRRQSIRHAHRRERRRKPRDRDGTNGRHVAGCPKMRGSGPSWRRWFFTTPRTLREGSIWACSSSVTCTPPIGCSPMRSRSAWSPGCSSSGRGAGSPTAGDESRS